MKKICMAYFAQETSDYTPTDVGYVIAQCLQKNPDKFEFNLKKLTYRRSRYENAKTRIAERERILETDALSIIKNKPDAVFFFTDSVIWSKVLAIGRAVAIARIIRRKAPQIFIGVCSYKIEGDKAGALFDEGIIDAAVTNDHEAAFCHLSRILEMQPVGNVLSRVVRTLPKLAELSTKRQSKNLDHIPSPYLSHVFDDFLAYQQIKRNGKFRAFLSSSRGCHFDCFYCARSIKFESVKYFSADRFFSEMSYLVSNFHIFRFFVLDDAFMMSRARLSELVRAFEEKMRTNPDLSKVSIFVMARPETVDEEVVSLMLKINVKYLQIGLQTINPQIQHYMGRPIDIDRFRQIKLWLDQAAINLQLDVILGLPSDSVAWMNKTVDYATSLNPYSIQLKQLYLNPFTVFDRDKESYGIKVDEQRDVFDADFDAPYVVQGAGIDETYFNETNSHIMSSIKRNPHIRWKYLGRKETHVSASFYNVAGR